MILATVVFVVKKSRDGVKWDGAEVNIYVICDEFNNVYIIYIDIYIHIKNMYLQIYSLHLLLFAKVCNVFWGNQNI